MASELLKKQAAVVVGSTKGIGEEIARQFAAEGAAVVISGLEEDRGQAVAESIAEQGGRAVFQACDVTRPNDCRALCERAEREFGGLDILVNNAGIYPPGDFAETTPELWDRVFAVNVRGPFLCSQAAVPLMRKRGGGSIINIGSCHPWHIGEGQFAYGVSKGALLTLTRKLAGLLRSDRIRVNWITVGWVLTENELDMHRRREGGIEYLEKRRQTLPWGYNTELDIAQACVYLASEAGLRVTDAN